MLTLLGMIFFNLVSAITTEYAVYAMARFYRYIGAFLLSALVIFSAGELDLITTINSFHLYYRFLVGFFVAGNILSIVVLMSEIVGASW